MIVIAGRVMTVVRLTLTHLSSTRVYRLIDAYSQKHQNVVAKTGLASDIARDQEDFAAASNSKVEGANADCKPKANEPSKAHSKLSLQAI